MGFLKKCFLAAALALCAPALALAESAPAKPQTAQNAKSANVSSEKSKDTAKPAAKDAAKKKAKPKPRPPEPSPYESSSDAFVPINEIDNIVLQNLKVRSLKPARLCSDAVFLRRVYIALCGTVPTREEVEAFLSDKSADKRARLVDELLASEQFALRMTMRLGDMLRIKAEFPVNLWPNAAQAYSRYIYESVYANRPYSEIVRQMLTSVGSNFREGEVNFFRAMQAKNDASIASCVALSFMGMRYDKMPENVRRNMAEFFSRVSYKSTKEWKEEIVFNDPFKRAPFSGVLPDGGKVSLSSREDPRAAFASWLVAKGNPYFSRAFANRLWHWLYGQPIVSPVDDMFAENKPANAELLDHLALYFEASGFDIKKLCRHIVLSRVFMQSFIPRCEPAEAKKYFAVYPVARIDAEALADIICKISGTAEIYESTTPEPYTKFPAGESAVALPDGSITTSFLELFGRPSRDTGFDSERVLAPSAAQKLHMINSRHIRAKIESGEPLRAIYKLGGERALRQAYLAVLSRYPTSAERASFYRLMNARPKRDRGYYHILDTVWALFNSEEFINQH